MKNLPLLGIVIAVFFIFLGINLIQKDDTFIVIVGYANIIVFSGVIIFTLYKLLSNKKI